MKYSELAEELIGRGLAEDTAARMEERAMPVFADTVQQVMAEQLRRLERRLARRMVGIERSAGMASRIGYAHLYRDHPDEAEADWQEASEQIEQALQASGPLISVDDRARAVEG